MRVLLIIDCLSSGGAQRQLSNLATAMAKRGHQTHVYSYFSEPSSLAGELQAGGVEHSHGSKRWRYSIQPSLDIRRLIRAHAFDGMVAFLTTPSVYAMLARLGSAAIPLIVSERNMPRASALSRWHAQRFRLADYVTTNAYAVLERLHQQAPWLTPRSAVIRNGVDSAYFTVADASSEPTAQLKLLALGSVIARKNPVSLIHALAEYRRTYAEPVPHISWAGRSNYSNEGNRTFVEAEQLLRREGLSQHWRWLGEVTNVRKQLQDCDALIHPGVREGCPNAICEAMAAARPVLASDRDEIPRLIADGVTGYLFDPESAKSIAEVIYRFSQRSAAERLAIGRAGREFARGNLSMDAYARAYETLLLELQGR